MLEIHLFVIPPVVTATFGWAVVSSAVIWGASSSKHPYMHKAVG